jgi:excisionase family DNA binding protein
MSKRKETFGRLAVPPDVDLLTIRETAYRTRLSESTIRSWILARKIVFIKLGSRVFIRRETVESLCTRGV